jgi:acyl carrier protein
METFMNKQEFLNRIEEIIEVDAGSLNGDEVLDDLEDWDSLAVMGFIAMVDKHFGITLDAEKIGQCRSVNELCDLLGNKVSK